MKPSLLFAFIGALSLGTLVGCGDDDLTDPVADAGDNGDGAINRPDSGPGPDGSTPDAGPPPETFTAFAKRLVLTETKDNNAPQPFTTFANLTDTPVAGDFPASFFP
jgi:hypothetical protein